MEATARSLPASPRGRVLAALSIALLALPLAGCRDDGVRPAAPRLDRSSSVAATPTIYHFEPLVDSRRDGFESSEFGCPAINDAGEVAFRAQRSTGELGVYRVTGNTLVTIAEDPDRFDHVSYHPSINNLGQVSFAAVLDAGGQAIFRGQGRGLTRIARSQPGRFSRFLFDTSINDDGTVAFMAEFESSARGLFTGDGAEPRLIYVSTIGPFQGASGAPAINEDGHIAFREELDQGGAGIFLWNGRRFVTLALTGSDTDFVGDASLNNDGVVALHAELIGERGIFTGTRPRNLVKVAGLFPATAYISFGDPSINDVGRVAFSARVEDSFQEGIFTGPHASNDQVVFDGDVIAGLVAREFAFCRDGLNNSGQLAFTAFMEDGRTLVVRATPQPA